MATFIKILNISGSSNTLRNPKIVSNFFDQTSVLYGNDISLLERL